MNTVVLPGKTPPIVEAKDLPLMGSYGVLINLEPEHSVEERCWITQDCTGAFTVRGLQGLTVGIGWIGFNSLSLDETVKKLLLEGHQVFQFDTAEKMMKWVIFGPEQ